MKKNYLKEIVVSLILIVLSLLLINPFMLWMPTAVAMSVVVIFAVIFFVFASLVFKEKSGDEREDLHKLMASRIAYLVGATVLVVAIVAQSLMHAIDPWLIVALTAMVLAKVVSLGYRDHND